MPGYKGHLVGGAIAFGLTLYCMQNLNPSCATISEWFACSIAGSLFPDIDVKSRGQNYFYKILLFILGFLLIKGAIHLFMILALLAFTPMLVRHRGIFHTLWFVTIIPFFLALILSAYFPRYGSIIFFDVLFFVAGAISHLWLDLGVRRMLRF